MDLNGKTLLVISQLSSPFGGNFIPSLNAKANYLVSRFNMKIIFCFPSEACERSWFIDLGKKYNVIGIPHPDEVATDLTEIIIQYNPDIIHTHFDGYDVPISIAVRELQHKAQVIWHLHNTLVYQPDFLRKTYQFFMFIKKFSLNSKNVSVIGVSPEVLTFANKHNCGRFENTIVIKNGIVEDRLVCEPSYHDIFTFGIIGGRNEQKRIDILLDALAFIPSDLQYQVFIIEGDVTDVLIKKKFRIVPDNITVLPPLEEIAPFYKRIDCFISTSVHETFSCAVAEATFAGKAVIQSDIPGTMWNSENPSVFLFKNLDSKDLARKMEKVMRMDKTELQRACALTKIKNINNFGIEKWCEDVSAFYQKL